MIGGGIFVEGIKVLFVIGGGIFVEEIKVLFVIWDGIFVVGMKDAILVGEWIIELRDRLRRFLFGSFNNKLFVVFVRFLFLFDGRMCFKEWKDEGN